MDDRIPCVYNANHLIKPEKLVWHYVKCDDRRRLQHLFEVCPYNSMHHVPKPEYDAHIQRCKPPTTQINLNFGVDDPWG
ncbi:hypothetical protein SteCoe_5576 [Stentor coeruleus]|uniref:CHHC U11-48K-type domain-containing protein n=1 Tax=Stentor coeruleus TaxID=5963 RepID=A0A1R2CS37_9CILI|nr:hypothetical protein SteCoe_5576 [Stentor coeruleus]